MYLYFFLFFFSLFVKLSPTIFFFLLAAWLAGSQFPDQGLNPGWATAVKAWNPNH